MVRAEVEMSKRLQMSYDESITSTHRMRSKNQVTRVAYSMEPPRTKSSIVPGKSSARCCLRAHRTEDGTCTVHPQPSGHLCTFTGTSSIVAARRVRSASNKITTGIGGHGFGARAYRSLYRGLCKRDRGLCGIGGSDKHTEAYV